MPSTAGRTAGTKRTAPAADPSTAAPSAIQMPIEIMVILLMMRIVHIMLAKFIIAHALSGYWFSR
jgi:hypothetical protein